MATEIVTTTFHGVVKSRTEPPSEPYSGRGNVPPKEYTYIVTIEGTCKDASVTSANYAEVGDKVSFTETTGAKGTLVAGFVRS